MLQPSSCIHSANSGCIADAVELVSVRPGSLLMCDAAQASLQGLMRDFGYEVRSAVVLTPYRAQLGLLQREFQRVLGRGAKELAAVEFATVDGFQVGCCSSCPTSGWVAAISTLSEKLAPRRL